MYCWKNNELKNDRNFWQSQCISTRKEEIESILLIDEDKNEEVLVSFKEIKKVHEVNNYKGKELLIHAYTNAGLLGPGVVKTITHFVNDCKICQKFMKYVI